MNLLLLGGSGFVSGRLAEMALKAGHQVWCVTRGNRDLSPDVHSIIADRNDPSALRAALLEQKQYWDACLDCICFNADQARTDLTVLQGVAARVIVISTDSVYHPAHKTLPQTEEADQYLEDGSYGALKRQMELVFLADGGKTLPFTLFRPGHIFGPGSLLGCYPMHTRQRDLADRIRNEETLELVGGDAFLIQPIYVDDLCRVMLESIPLPSTQNRIFCIGGPDVVTNAQYFRILGDLMGHPAHIRDLPLEGFLEANPKYSGHLCNRSYDLSALKSTGIRLPETTLREGLQKQIEWLDAQE